MLKTSSKEYKFVLVGDSAVGKSSLLNRFVDKVYSESFLSTIGVDFKFKRVKIDNNDVKLQIWDTAGQQTFRSIVSAYYTSADAIIITYDITSYDSFQVLNHSKFRTQKIIGLSKPKITTKIMRKSFLLVTKLMKKVEDKFKSFLLIPSCKSMPLMAHIKRGIFFKYKSAKTGQNVEETFTDIARNLYYGTKQKIIAPKSLQTNNKNSEITGTQLLGAKQNRRSIVQNVEEDIKSYKEDEYEEVLSVENDTREERNEKKQKEERIKINQNSVKPKPKNPNYTKGCCLK